MKKTLQIFLVLLIAAVSVNAQQISGSVADQQKAGISGATISLHNTKDSAVVKLTTSDKEGKYNFQSIKAGRYFIRASHVGYANIAGAPFDWDGKADLQLPALGLALRAKELQGVTVSSQKPMVEVKADKTILNVEGTINATGSNAFDLLRKSPGVLIDKDDNLSLSGKNGVQIYIDGRPSPLGGKDLAEYLKTIQSSMIESIELITNPSAKYDAAGNAGIINIRLKKNKAMGTNGSVNAGYNIGVYPKYNAGLALNHRDKSVNLFSTYNFNQATQENNISIYRTVLDTLFDQHTLFTFKPTSHNFKVGMDYFINRKSTFGVLVNGNLASGNMNSSSATPITYIPTNTLVKNLVAGTESSFTRNNINGNINYKYSDTSGHDLNMDVDYGYYRIRTNQLQPNYYFDASGKNETSRFIYQMITPNDIHIYSFKTDYEQNFAKGKLGIGGKISVVNSDNDFQRYNVYTSNKVLDTLKSNQFNYKENINAGYVNYNRQLKGWMLQLGVRVENTHSTGRSSGFRNVAGSYVRYDSSFDRNYTDFFPSAAITFNKNPMNQWSLSYSRRIDRPSYQSLNPFEFKLDEYTFQKGNTQLTPQYTNSFGITNTYKYKLTTTLNYSHVKDVFTQIIDTAERSKAFITQKNLATQDIVSLNISYPLQIKWYTAFMNLNAYYSHYKANFGAGRIVDLDAYAVNYFMQNSFKLGKGWTGEISGNYSSPTIAQGTFKMHGLWSTDLGLQKVIMKGKGNLKVAVSDVFHTMQPHLTSDFAGQQVNTRFSFESRQLKLNFSYRFGSNTVKAARQRKTGLDDESKRVQSQSGGGLGNN
ncbi:MAG: TonB-dependent receptor [Chitinophagaceae bacterium]|nr:TonB-dependent receptor [Chitinophagaceae bacterium]